MALARSGPRRAQEMAVAFYQNMAVSSGHGLEPLHHTKRGFPSRNLQIDGVIPPVPLATVPKREET